MDGWESRRKRMPGHDWAIVRLGITGIIHGVVVDTSFFTGNYPEHCIVEGCVSSVNTKPEDLKGWVELRPKSALRGDAQNSFGISRQERFTHLRLSIFPDGGVARFRAHGEALPDWRQVMQADLVSAEFGGTIVDSSDRHYGHPRNMIMPGRAANMGDGWETRRRRGPGHDWAVLRLGTEGVIERIEVDTSHFKGNYPDSCSMESSLTGDDDDWHELLPKTNLLADTRHQFRSELNPQPAARFVRLNIFPDGGVSRLRIWGKPTDTGRIGSNLTWLNAQTDGDANIDLRRCCGSSRWVAKMTAARPFPSLAALETCADEIWSACTKDDYLEAFAAHPKIGQRSEGKWSSQEQAGATEVTREVGAALQKANVEYQRKYGFIFIVCATGKSASEMLAILQSRLHNDQDTEIRNAAEEQRNIMQLRLRKLLSE
jgi:allantoicase